MLTAMIYLNEGFEGGATDFDLPGPRVQRGARARNGADLRTPRAPPGGAITRGVKYVLRTDVMHRRPAPR